VGSDRHCDNGWDQTRALLACMDNALSTVRECRRSPTIEPGHHGQAPHVCCCRAGRKVRPWKSGQGSVSQAGSPACRPKACSGRTSQPTMRIPSTAFPLPIAWIIKKFRDEDPPAQPKLAIPVSTITAISENYRWTPHLSAVVDLTLIAFFYLLRVGEYTTPSPPKGQPPR
jgi:hypothetical protein